eukprot:gene9626-biopygen3136
MRSSFSIAIDLTVEFAKQQAHPRPYGCAVHSTECSAISRTNLAPNRRPYGIAVSGPHSEPKRDHPDNVPERTFRFRIQSSRLFVAIPRSEFQPGDNWKCWINSIIFDRLPSSSGNNNAVVR